MSQYEIVVVIFGMAVVTYLPRLLPALLLSQRSLSPRVSTWLSYVPIAVLAALVLPSISLRNGSVSLSPDNLFLWAAIPTVLVAWMTRSLFATVLFGMAVVATVRLLAG